MIEGLEVVMKDMVARLKEHYKTGNLNECIERDITTFVNDGRFSIMLEAHLLAMNSEDISGKLNAILCVLGPSGLASYIQWSMSVLTCATVHRMLQLGRESELDYALTEQARSESESVARATAAKSGDANEDTK